MNKFIGIIPARLASTRFPEKLIKKIHGLPIIEHVRRRSCLVDSIDEVYVASNDTEILDLIKNYQGLTIQTFNNHENGTSRMVEAVKNIDYTHIVLIQGDEPLILPSDIELLIRKINNSQNSKEVWNCISRLADEEELTNDSVVKCNLNNEHLIVDCKRKYENIKDFNEIYELLGLFVFSKDIIRKYNQLKNTPRQKKESIEQLKILENNFKIKSCFLQSKYQSVNKKEDLEKVLEILDKDMIQKNILRKILNL